MLSDICRKIQKEFDEFLKKRKMMKAAMTRSTAESAVSCVFEQP